MMVTRRRQIQAVAAILAATTCVLVAGGQSALADASSHASCVGIEASAISPPGSSDELPGGMPELIAFVKGLGGPAGAVIGSLAKLHEGSHEACDEATG